MNLSFKVYIDRNVSYSILYSVMFQQDISTCTAVFMYLNVGYEIFKVVTKPPDCAWIWLVKHTTVGQGSCCKFGVMATEIAVNHWSQKYQPLRLLFYRKTLTQ